MSGGGIGAGYGIKQNSQGSLIEKERFHQSLEGVEELVNE